MLVLNALEEWSDIAEYLEVPKHIFSGSCADKVHQSYISLSLSLCPSLFLSLCPSLSLSLS